MAEPGARGRVGADPFTPCTKLAVLHQSMHALHVHMPIKGRCIGDRRVGPFTSKMPTTVRLVLLLLAAPLAAGSPARASPLPALRFRGGGLPLNVVGDKGERLVGPGAVRGLEGLRERAFQRGLMAA